MKTRRFPTTVSLGLFVLILVLLGVQTATWGQAMPAAVAASPVGTAFTYQGQLQSGGTPVDDNCDFDFGLWDAVAGGNPVGSSQPALNIPVIGGLFAVELDFGSGAFTGEARWLQTAVRCPAGGGEYTTLAPRQAMNPVPYAMLSQDLRLPFDKRVNSPLTAFSVSNDGDGRALFAETKGSGHAVNVVASGSGNAVAVWSYGSGGALSGGQEGTGDALGLNITNPDNTASVIDAQTNGLGVAADIRIRNPANMHSVLHVTTDGGGWAGNFENEGSGGGVNIDISNPLNAQPAINVHSVGSQKVAYFVNEGSGGGVQIESPVGTEGLSVYGGSKNAVVPTSEGARLLYTEESSEVWFTDYGFGRLAAGSVFIAIDPLFAETVNLEEPYHVFVQAYGDADLYVSQRTPQGFEVRLRAGDPEVEFSYRLVATRRGYEGKRLEPAAWADKDPNLNPAEPGAPENGGAE